MSGGYVPSAQASDRLKKVDFVAVVGPTGAGKSTLINEAAKRWTGLRLAPSTTSRAPRPGEVDGVDFWFKTKDQMEQRIAKREYATVVRGAFGGDIYATAPEDYPTKRVGIMPVLASAIPMFAALPFKNFRVVFVVPPEFEVWMSRIRPEQFPPAKRQARLAEAKQSIQFALDNADVCRIINDDLEQAVKHFLNFAQDDVCSDDHVQSTERLNRLLVRLDTNQE